MGIGFEWARILAVVVGLLPCFGSAAYKGVLLSTNAQRGWKDARWMGGYLTNSALLIGCAELLVLSALMGQTQATAILRTAFIVLLVLNVIPIGIVVCEPQEIPHLGEGPAMDHGPVMVYLEFRIEPSQAAEFDQAMRALEPIRRRDGAVMWSFFSDIADPRRYVEAYMVET